MRRRIVPLVLLLLTAMTACSDSSMPAPPQPRPMGPENPSAPSSPEFWLGRVCTALGPAVRTASPVPEIAPEDPVGSRDRMVAYLDERAGALRTAADGVAATGPAPTEAGLSVTTPVLGLLRQRADVLAGLREQLAAVPANAGGTLMNTLQQVRGQLVLAGPAVGLRDLALPPDLAAVAAHVPACRTLGAGAGS